MKRILFFIIAYTGALLGQEASATGDRNVDTLINDGNVFAFQLYSLLVDQDENLAFSPFAISESLALVYQGADGSTASQMARILRFRPQQFEIPRAFDVLNKQLDDSPYYFNAGLWIQRGEIKADFQDRIEKQFHAYLRQVDFATRADSIRVDINNWFRSRTQGKIADIIPLRDLTNLTRMVATSSAYVKGRWDVTFDPNESKQLPYFRGRYTTSTVPAMFATSNFNYIDSDTFSMLEIPYELRNPSSSRVSLLIVLPHDTYGLKTVESSLTADKLRELLPQMQSRRVVLSVPKFRINERFDLVSILIKMGLNDPFGEYADFEGIRKGNELRLSKVWHQTLYSIDEWGSEGGISTGGGWGYSPNPLQVVTFQVDHPFMFLVVHKQTGLILLMGRISNP